jgi:MFS family permease
MDSFIYALVMVPALRDLLPASGIPDTPANQGYYGGLLFALFLIGWGFAFLWGPIADKFGRVRTLMFTILWYSMFTFFGALAHSVWQLAAFRFLAGIGIGGEWAMGGTFVAEEWPEERRVWGAAWMHTGYYVGILLAGVMNGPIAGHYGWRAMFAVGGAPALIVGFIRYGVTEPKRWLAQADISSGRSALAELFNPEYRWRTVLNCLFVLVSITGLWAGSVYVPATVIHLATRSGLNARVATHLASSATVLLSIATILGCLALPVLASRLGRRGALALFFTVMAVSIPVTFGYVFYLPEHALEWFFVCLLFIGFGGGSFALYTLWLPEQYRTTCRATAFALATSIGRFVGAGITFLVGAGVAHFHSIGVPIAITGLAFVVGLALVPFAYETRGHPLPL